MRNETDYYVVLQVDPRAEDEVIEAAYRRLAIKYHPDRNPSVEANSRMKLINAAYEVLSNPERRREYDLRRRYLAGEHQSAPQVGRRPGRQWWLLAMTVGIAAMALLSRSPQLVVLLVVLLLVLWSLSRPQRG